MLALNFNWLATLFVANQKPLVMAVMRCLGIVQWFYILVQLIFCPSALLASCGMLTLALHIARCIAISQSLHLYYKRTGSEVDLYVYVVGSR